MNILKAKVIKCVLFDVDGVLSSGHITYTSSGDEIKSFNAKDGFGINLLNTAGLITGIITARVSNIVEKRAKELNFSIVFTGERKKLNAYQKIKEKYSLLDEEIAFVGDDILDLAVLNACGFSCSPKNAVTELIESVDFVSQFNGGDGAVREICEVILKSQNKYDDLIQSYLEL